MSSRRISIAFCETVAQVSALMSYLSSPADLPVVLAVTAEAFYECKRRGIVCKSLDAFGDISTLTPIEGPKNICRVEAICSIFDEHLHREACLLPEGALVSCRAFFHPLKGFVDSLTLRLLPMLKAFEDLSPSHVIGFRPYTYPVPGPQLLDKPPLGLVTSLLPIIAEYQQIPVSYISCIENAAEPCSVSSPPKTEVHISFFRRCKQVIKREMVHMLRWRDHFSVPISPENLKTSWEEYLASRRRESVDSPTLLTVPSTVDGFLDSFFLLWNERRYGRSSYMPDITLPVSLMSGISKECWRVSQNMRMLFIKDTRLKELCIFHGIDLCSFLIPFLEKIITSWLVDLLTIAHSGRAYYSGFTNAVLFFGGVVHSHFVLARAARAEGIPVVTWHKGGFLGYAYVPVLERYDLAESDFFLCNGPSAVRTLAVSHSEACWNRETPRAVPVPLCAPWVFSAPSTKKYPGRRYRVMYIMSAILADNCYMGYTFPPEVEYVQLQVKIWKLARANPLVDFIFKPPLEGRYPQLQSPVLDIIRDNPCSWIFVQNDIPLSQLLDSVDIFIVDCPSTPVADIVPTGKHLVLYADKIIYKIASHAKEPLRKRTLFSDNEADFLKSIASVLQDPDTFTASPIDQTFTHEFLTGGKQGGCPQMIADFLESLFTQTM